VTEEKKMEKEVEKHNFESLEWNPVFVKRTYLDGFERPIIGETFSTLFQIFINNTQMDKMIANPNSSLQDVSV